MTLCANDEMQQLIDALRRDDGDALGLSERYIDAYPDDARLHFLRGSILAGGGRPIEAHASLSRAVALAPDFALARFQLGFFELTSGEAVRALATWAPLATTLPDDHHLRRFVTGLDHLVHDGFDAAADALRVGIAANDENPVLRRDMAVVVVKCVETSVPETASTGQEASATSFFLDQFSDRGTTH